jgi:prepilin-type N-terminal cleavage/methylation domain-containing protein
MLNFHSLPPVAVTSGRELFDSRAIMARTNHHRAGVTLLELVVVMAVLVALAAVVVPLLSHSTGDAAITATQTNLRQAAEAIHRYRTDTGITPDQIVIADLFQRKATVQAFDTTTRIGWNGPYLSNGGSAYLYTVGDPYGFTTAFSSGSGSLEPCVFDGFPHSDGHRCPIVLVKWANTSTGKFSVWLQSAGPDGILNIPNLISGPPIPNANGAGSDFPSGSSFTHVDDLTYLVYTQP